jgi:hypothetical protein
VAVVVVLVGGQLGARADDEVAAQGVQRLALLSWPVMRERIGGSAQKRSRKLVRTIRPYSPSAAASGVCGELFFSRVSRRLAGTQPRLSDAAARSSSS